MKLNLPESRPRLSGGLIGRTAQGVLGRARGMFNLNDPRWGRGDESAGHSGDAQQPNANPGATPNPNANPGQNAGQNSGQSPGQSPEPSRKPAGATQGPPDLEELWRDFNKKLNGLLGGKRGGSGGSGGSGSGGPGLPDFKNAGLGVGVIAAVLLLLWLGTGFFIVQEGQQAVITQFGKYKSTVGAGFNWRLPYPVQKHELIFVTQIRSVDVGRDAVIKTTGLRESAMLTEDENIVEIKFAVQYRLNDARAYLFESRNPGEAVVQAAETAVREVVGKMKMDSALSEERDQIAPRVRALMQSILDRYKVGIEVVGINLQQGGVRPPEQVQAAFDDVLKAGQERERAKNEAQAYANDVIPRAQGSASRLMEEAQAYKSRIVSQAQGDAQRFRSVLNEYQKAPQVTRDRLYIDAMQQIYSNVTKVMVETQNGMLYLPLDKIMQMTASEAAAAATPAVVPQPATPNTTPSADIRGRDSGRSRDRDAR